MRKCEVCSDGADHRFFRPNYLTPSRRFGSESIPKQRDLGKRSARGSLKNDLEDRANENERQNMKVLTL